MSDEPKRILIETDAGVDDFLALTYLANADCAEIVGINTVPGNVGREQVLQNAAYIADALDLNIPINKGVVDQQGPEHDSRDIHGDDGLGGITFNGTDCDVYGLSTEFLFNNMNDGIDLLVIGPLSNIARAIDKHHSLLQGYQTVTIMGGGIGYGNTPHGAEFNFWKDPRAAKKVLDAPGEQRLVTGDICQSLYPPLGGISRRAVLQTIKHVIPSSWLSTGTYPPSLMVYESVRGHISQIFPTSYRGVLFDPIAAALCLHPEFGNTELKQVTLDPERTQFGGITSTDTADSTTDGVEMYSEIAERRIMGELWDNIV